MNCIVDGLTGSSKSAQPGKGLKLPLYKVGRLGFPIEKDALSKMMERSPILPLSTVSSIWGLHRAKSVSQSLAFP